MTTGNEQHDRRVELENLLVAASLNDASDAQLDRLNDLLRESAELRHFAAQFFEEEAVLRHQFQVLGRVGEFHSPLARDDAAQTSPSRCAVGASRLATRWRLRQSASFVLTASLLAVAIGAALWIRSGSPPNGAGSFAEEATASTSPENSQHGLLIPATAHLPRVTRVSWSGPQFASEVRAAVGTARLREGVVPFTSVNGQLAQGYMVHLPPGGQLDLVVSADADGENSLAVIEFESDGTPTGRRITFSNSLADRSRGTSSGRTGLHTRFGPIGSWSERNSSTYSKYYCFTSVHKLLDRTKDDSWQVSRLSVMFAEPHLAHIGWDDSGMVHPDRPAEGQKPDLDFDDLSATIRIHRPDQPLAVARDALRVIADESTADATDAEPLAPAKSTAGFSIAVGPQKTVVIKVTNRFRTPTEIALVDKSTGRIWWQQRTSSRPAPSSAACAIQNDSRDARQFAIVAEQPQTSDRSNNPNSITPSILFEQSGFVSLVFDEGPDDPDYDDVKVDLLTMDPL